MKNTLLGILIFMFLSINTFSQGLEDVIVEKIAVPASAIADDPTIPSNAYTYRVFLDMAGGYQLNSVFSLVNHKMVLKTTTSFYNHADGSTTGKEINPNLIKISPSLAYDSYLTINAATKTSLGILFADDTQDGKVDGYFTGTAGNTQTVEADFSIPFGSAPYAGEFISNKGIWNTSLGGEKGPTASNRIFIGQFTTDGNFSFELNFQIRKPIGSQFRLEQYVNADPGPNEIKYRKCIYPVPTGSDPIISLTTPADNAEVNLLTPVTLTASASDADGTVTSVQFFVDDELIATVNNAPYQTSWNNIKLGKHEIRAVAYDNNNYPGFSNIVYVTTKDATPPNSVKIIKPDEGKTYATGDTVQIEASASDNYQVKGFDFYIDGNKVGTDTTSQIAKYKWKSTQGSHQLTVTAFDAAGNRGNSPVVNITVGNIITLVESVTINSAGGTSVNVGLTLQLSANVLPATASNKTVTWSVTNGTGQATINQSGLLTGTVAGTVIAKATANDLSGKFGELNLTVTTIINIPVSSIVVTGSGGSTSVTTGSTLQLSAAILPDNATNKTVTWSVTNGTGQATINTSGLLTGVALGTVTAKATANDGSLKVGELPLTIASGSNPVVSLTAPAYGKNIKVNTIEKLTATASDPGGTITKVEFFVNELKVGEDLTSPYEYDWTTVKSTPTNITARATDNSGNTAVTDPVMVYIVDNLPPVISLTNPKSNDTLVTDSNVLITATASDPDGSVTLVEFLRNGTVIGQDNTAPYEYSWKCIAGISYINVRATDNLGIKTQTDQIKIVGNGLHPAVSITSPVEGAVLTAGANYTISANASDTKGTITLVEFYRNDTKLGEDATAPYQYSWIVAEGNSKLTARATNSAGKQTTSLAINVSSSVIEKDTLVFDYSKATISGLSYQLPVSVISNKTVNSFSFNCILNPAKLAYNQIINHTNYIQATGNYNQTDKKLTVSAISNQSPIEKNKAVISIAFSMLTGAVSDNDLTQFKAFINGNECAVKVIFGFPDLFPPVVNITSPVANSTYNEGTVIPINASASDVDPMGKIEKVEFYANNVKIGEDLSAPYSYNWTSVAGKPIITAKATDMSGKQTTSIDVPLTIEVVICQCPVVSITSPIAGTRIDPAGTVVNIAANATDADGTITLVEFFVNGTKIGEDATAPYSIDWTSIAGTANIAAKATDNINNQTTSAVVSIEVASTGGTPPVVSVTSPTSDANVNANEVVVITANATDPDGTIASVEFYVNDSKIGKDVTSPYQMNWVSSAGSAVIKAIAVDNTGLKTTSALVTIGVNALPTVIITAPTEGSSFTAGETIKISATATDGDGTVSLVEFFVKGAKVGEDNTSPYEFNWISVGGQTTISAIVTDNKNAKTTSNIITVSVNIPPVVEITAPANGSKYVTGEIVTISANASDADGSVKMVEFYFNSTMVGKDSIAPYLVSWTSVAGKAQITAIATDNSGAKVTSDPVSIEVINPYQLVNTEFACSRDRFSMPLEVKYPLSNVIGFDIVIGYDKNRVSPSGVITISSDLINATYADYAVVDHTDGTMNISVFLKPSAPEGTNFTGTGKLLYIEFMKKSAYSSNDTALFSVPSLIESYITGVQKRVGQSGKSISYKDYNLHGVLKFWNNGTPISYDSKNPDKNLKTDIFATDADCKPIAGQTAVPDLSGNFKFDVRNGQTLGIKRDIAPGTEVSDAINASDAQMMMQIILGNKSVVPSAFQMIAMDVNMDGVLSSGDVSQINQRSILMIKEYKQAWNYNNQGVKIVDELSKDWLFVDSSAAASNPEYKISASFPLEDGKGFAVTNTPDVPKCHTLSVQDLNNCPIIDPKTYFGVLLGDVNGNYSTMSANRLMKSAVIDEDEVMVFDMGNATLKDNKLEIPIYITADSVNALNFRLKYNFDEMDLDTIINHTSFKQSIFYLNPDDSIYRFTAYVDGLNGVYYDKDIKLFSLQFDLKEDASIDTSDLGVKTVLLNGDAAGYLITEYDPVGIEQHNNLTPFVRLYPNPVLDVIYLEIQDDAKVQLLDITGKVVIDNISVQANQKNEINVASLISGVYLIKIDTGSKLLFEKVIIK